MFCKFILCSLFSIFDLETNVNLRRSLNAFLYEFIAPIIIVLCVIVFNLNQNTDCLFHCNIHRIFHKYMCN